VPFNKREPGATWDRAALRSWPLIEPLFGAIGADPVQTMAEQSKAAKRKVRPTGLALLFDIAWRVLRQEGPLEVIRRTGQFAWRLATGR
jgi:hypothetical protein